MALYLWNDRPSRLLDQHFGLGLEPEDLVAPLVPRELHHMLHSPYSHGHGYLRPWRSGASQQDVGSTVTYDKDHFQANLDVQQFKPEEISVKVSGDNVITIEGKHEEKEDDHGFISRHFVRRYVLPKGHDVGRIESRLSSDGVLTITAPKVKQGDGEESRRIPITQTGQPSKAIQENKEKKQAEKKK